MNTPIFKQLLLPVLALAATTLGACGPMYTEDRWYAREYYANNPGAWRPAPVQNVAVAAAPMVQPDPQFTDLTPYGQWEMTGEYGRVWVPYANRTPGWRPYYYGSWSYTDWGWSWVSDEVWGAGPYHYGRWTWMNGRGWAWIPDYTWGPSWVVWSSGGGCVGWAPMGPGGASYVDIHAHATYWTYVPTNQFGGGKVQHVVVSAADVPRVHSQTVVINDAASVRGTGGQVVSYHPGPARDQVQQWTARPVDTRPIAQVPSVQPRRIPDNATPPSGGSQGTAIAPAPGRGGPVVANPGVPTGPTTPTTPTGPNVGTRPGVGNPNPTTPDIGTRPGVGVPTTQNPTTPTNPNIGTRPGVVGGTTSTPPYNPPTRPGVGTPTTNNPIVEPPTRPGVGSTPGTTDAPGRPGAGYIGPAPVTINPLPTVPRPTPPPVENNLNYAPTPSRYTPPAYNPAPSRAATPSYTPTPSYNPAPSYNPTPSYQPQQRQATPSYQPTPSYNPTPSYQPQQRQAAPSYQPTPSYQPSRPATPSYSPPPQQQRFSPPPAFAPSAQRAAPPAAAPAPQRRR